MSKSTFRTILAVLVAVVVYTSYRYSEDITNTLSNINFSTIKPTTNKVVEEIVGTGDDMSLTGDDMALSGEMVEAVDVVVDAVEEVAADVSDVVEEVIE